MSVVEEGSLEVIIDDEVCRCWHPQQSVEYQENMETS